MNDLFPILFMQISSLTSKILCGIVILEIAGFKNAISTEAVEWNPTLPPNKSIKKPSKKE